MKANLSTGKHVFNPNAIAVRVRQNGTTTEYPLSPKFRPGRNSAKPKPKEATSD